MKRPITDCKYNNQDGIRCTRGIQGRNMCFYHYNKTRYTKQAFTRTSIEQRQEIVSLYESGLSANQVARKVGYSKKTILKYATDAGVVRSEEKSQGIKYAKVRRGRYSGVVSKTPWLRRLNTNPEYREFRKRMFERDLWTCQWCGYKGARIQLDHILPKSIFPDLVFKEYNVRTLCVDCHLKTDTYAGRAAKNYARNI